ncbi:heparan-alpha-glucosaminide N-acetyltransferase domain-containing protein [Streptomyces sp. SD31]|uniref:heparan-alpha-glucosaminide N-acetyltransferase domain-containing protein n=1 Tax=Streptomyces sp. SD31 TaxID=3452208 RepID=UPI003F892B4D
MTQRMDTAMPPVDEKSPTDAPADSSTGTPRMPGVSRLIGLDLARGLAVFGMYAAHVGPNPSEGGVTGFLMEPAHGRSSAPFAFLAGFAVVLITGRSAPKTGRAGRQAVAEVIIWAVILLAVGSALTMTGTPVEVILAFYGVYFLLVLPLYRLGAGTLAVIAAGTALVLPQVLYVVQQTLIDQERPSQGEPDGPISLFLTGSYPALTSRPGPAVLHDPGSRSQRGTSPGLAACRLAAGRPASQGALVLASAGAGRTNRPRSKHSGGVSSGTRPAPSCPPPRGTRCGSATSTGRGCRRRR